MSSTSPLQAVRRENPLVSTVQSLAAARDDSTGALSTRKKIPRRTHETSNGATLAPIHPERLADSAAREELAQEGDDRDADGPTPDGPVAEEAEVCLQTAAHTTGSA